MKARTRSCLVTLLLILSITALFPATLSAAEEGNRGWEGLWYHVGRVFNLVLVIAVVVWAARKPMSTFLADRSENIREQLAEAQRAREEAEAKLAEMESRMSGLDVELRELEASAEKDAKDEYARLLVEAERDADKVIGRARQEIEGMTRAAHMELREHAAELSVRMAEEKIREEMTEEDRSRLFARFVVDLGEKQ